MEIANATVATVGWDGQTIGPVPGTEHVFDVPQECGTQLIRLKHMGWRWPVPGDWTHPPTQPVPPPAPQAPVVPAVALTVSGPPPTVEVRDVLPKDPDGWTAVGSTSLDLEDPASADDPAAAQQEPEPLVLAEEVEAPDTEVPAEAVEAVADGAGATLVVTVPDALVAMAQAAGPDGLTSAAAANVHGRQVYNLLGKLVGDGRLVRIGRGLYAHPDHAPKA